MTDRSDFLAAVQVEVDRFHFDALIGREFGHIGGVVNLLPVDVPVDDTASAMDGRGGSETGAH